MMIAFQLFLSFFQIGMFSIGGGYAAMPLIQSEVVAGHGWLSMNEFTDLITIAEMTPGPISINAAAFVGVRVVGIPGVLIATLGCVLPSCLIVSLLALVYARYKNAPALQNVLGALRPAVVALIASAGLSILQMVAFNGEAARVEHLEWMRILLFAAAFLILRRLKWNPILVMLLCGAAALLFGLITGTV